ncbi:Vacuolar protein sorting-associated protein 13B [Frankliniella fusca]|uniref:Vacuolar protein sorting-associated protein 13B n=1 Tax=Frankliniella fusca TaxID=407009 RepID=A0AAE1H0V8_9NEOP|nr:Vacuolar protein sorting-associated protein 13B [Frankliniella fusca]
MFKLESYITPILLSYVDKYIKNFKPEDSQLSLWGGEVSLHNLDLRLEVLEEELQLPFTFVSGHIHELIIHVPWTKLYSEPICITINTIECILKLRGDNSTTTDGGGSHGSGKERRRRPNRPTDAVAPPGYVQTMVNKIVSNITINCCNLIVKYVEEDIVMSMNVKNLTFQSANERWEPEFSDFLSSQLMLRKIIKLSDVTVCLDKRNASGKIDSYQEPVLYRCSVVMRWLRCYSSTSAVRANVSRLDIHCKKMTFNISELQVPMMMRLLFLARALQNREVGQRSFETDCLVDIEEGDENPPDNLQQDSWTGWAWNLVPALPNWSQDWTGDESDEKGFTFHFGIYIDDLAFNLRVGENSSNDGNSWKNKAEPFLTLSLRGCLLDYICHDNLWVNSQLGISSIQLEPVGSCSCGLSESAPDKDSLFLDSGSYQDNYLAESLFSSTATENCGEKRRYNFSWDIHQNVHSESSLLEKTPALAIDYLYMAELTEKCCAEKFHEMNGNLEYSDLPEHSLCRTVVGPFVLRVNSGLLHRFEKVQKSAALYDYQPYSTPPPEDRREHLPAVTTEEYDSLEENIPLRTFQYTLFQPKVEFYVADHPSFPCTNKRKISITKSEASLRHRHSNFSIECQCLDTRFISPMYPRRLVRSACLLPTLPQHMFHACHSHTIGRVLGLTGQLNPSAPLKREVFSINNMLFKRKELFFTHLWEGNDILHEECSLEAEQLSILATKAQLLLVYQILSSLWDNKMPTSIVHDTSTAEGGILELVWKNINWQKGLTKLTRCDSVSVENFSADILTFSSCSPQNASEVRFPIISTAENDTTFIKACLQWPKQIAQPSHAPLFVLNIREAICNVDCTLYTWLLHAPSTTTVFHSSSTTSMKILTTDTGTQSVRTGHRKISDVSGSHMSCERTRRSQTPLSVHSSDKDRETVPPPLVSQLSGISIDDKTQSPEKTWQLSKWLVQWYPVWQGLVISVNIAHWKINFPTLSLTESDKTDAALRSIDKVCISLPVVQIDSATPSHKHSQFSFPSKLPVNLSPSTWMEGKCVSNFPWNISLSDLSVWTSCNEYSQYLLKPVTTKCTAGISTRFANGDKDCITSLGLCIHNDTGALHVTVNQKQAKILSNVLLSGSVVLHSLITEHLHAVPSGSNPVPAAPPSPTTVSESASVSETRNLMKNALCEPFPIQEDDVKLSIWLQWTLARLSMSFYLQGEKSQPEQKRSKLSLEVEDLMTSLDLQQIYSKLKLKVAGANVHHYIRSSDDKMWQASPYNGLVMCGYEEIAPPSSATVAADEGCGLLTVTLTRAKCRSVHSRWGAPTTNSSSKRYPEIKIAGSSNPPAACFITEILVKLQPLDFLVCVETLAELSTILHPFTILLGQPGLNSAGSVKSSAGNSLGMPSITSASLPLVYLDLQAVRVLMPTNKHFGFHDTFIIQVDSVTLSPHAENPLSRSPIRPDVFHMAEQARILSIPGSEVEDRQYELNVSGLAMSSGQWENIQKCRKLSNVSPASSLRTMSENPALVWNSLGSNTQGDASEIVGSPKPHLMSVLAPLKICIVGAPAIVYCNKVLVCGHALEINAVSDIDVTLTTNQMSLVVNLFSDVHSVLLNFLSKPEGSKVLKPLFLVELAEKQHHSGSHSTTEGVALDHLLFDSGIDTGDLSSIDTPHSSRIRGSRRVSRLPRYLESVHGPSIHSASSSHSWAPKSDKDGFASKVITEQPIDFFAGSRSSLHKEKSLISSDPLSGRDKHVETPFDFLITGSKISLMVYEDVEEADCLNGNECQQKSLLYILITQPHLFYSYISRSCSVQTSFYNAMVNLGSPHTIKDYKPSFSEKDFPITLFESRKGEPDSKTGVPPTLFITQSTFTPAKPAQVSIELSRPAKLILSTSNLQFISYASHVISSCFKQTEKKDSNPVEQIHAKKGFQQILENLSGIGSINLKSVQIVVVFQAENEDHINSVMEISVASLDGELKCTSRTRWGCNASAVERIVCHLTMKGLCCSSSHRLAKQLLLEPCNLQFRLELLWPVWLPRSLINSLPHTQLTIQSEYFSMTISPEHVLSLHNLCNAYLPIISSASNTHQSVSSVLHVSPSTPASDTHSSETDYVDTEQHYTDDLRAGAFQFMDATNTLERDQIPLPYQCVFWESSPPAIAWRYPQPRSLTNVHIYPVPFQSATDAEVGREDAPVVVCSLQYWSECRGAYQHYAMFLLSETNESKVELPTKPTSAVSAVWRVLLAGTQELHVHNQPVSDTGSSDSVNTEVPVVSPRALAACMRIDSFFSASLAPSLQACFNMTHIQVSLMNQLLDTQVHPMPHELKEFLSDGDLPCDHSFLWCSLNHCSLFYSAWPEGRKIAEFNSLCQLDVLDYGNLLQQNVLEPFLSNSSIALNVDGTTEISIVSRPIAFRLGPAVTHTIAASLKLWQQELDPQSKRPVQVLFSQYIVCNDTVLPIVFGQVETDEQIVLTSRQCHLYSWRSSAQKSAMQMSIIDPSIQKLGREAWSSPFSIDSLGTQICKISVQSDREIIIFVDISILSANQKKVTLRGQLQILHQVDQLLDLRLIRPSSDWSMDACNCLVPLQSNCINPSLVLDRNADDSQLAIRLRLRQTDASLWTGDIPLRENPKSHQPWLVKVPLYDKHQFICVWCRVIRETVKGHRKILVMLNPMYAVRSFLPTSMPAVISDDENKERRMSLEVKGQGEVTFLHLPGALKESNHQLNLRNGANMKVFPFGFSHLDPKKIFLSVDQANIESILDLTLQKNQKSAWPFPNEEFSSTQWVGVEISNSYVQAMYSPLSPYAGTMVLELQPWALVVNMLECSVCIEHSGEIIFSLPSRGVVAPPKLEGTFHLGLKFSDTEDWHLSEALQLARADWGKSFYMPRISGLVPIEGHVQISVKCGPTAVSLLTLRSQVVNDVRIISICSSFIVINSATIPLQVTPIALRHSDMKSHIPVPMKNFPETETATMDIKQDSKHRGYPLGRWMHMKLCESDIVPFICVSTEDANELSCPLRISGFPSRKRFIVPVSKEKSISAHSNPPFHSFVLSVVENNGQTFLNIADEPHPEIILHNGCDFRILCAEASPVGKSNTDFKISTEQAPWDWFCAVNPHCVVGYSTHTVDNMFPQISSTPPNSFVALAADPISKETVLSNLWSPPIHVSGKQEQFISIPGHGDVKVHSWVEGYSTHLSIEAVSRIEICAKDIRSRLSAVPEFPSVKIDEEIVMCYSSIPDEVLSYLSKDIDVSAPQEEEGSIGSTLISSDKKQAPLKLTIFIQSCSWTLMSPISLSEEIEISTLTLDNIAVNFCPMVPSSSQTCSSELLLQVTLGEFQLDNQLFEYGGFDFPVVLMGQQDKEDIGKRIPLPISLSTSASQLVNKFSPHALLAVNITLEPGAKGPMPKSVHVSIGPITAYIEDKFIMDLRKHVAALLSPLLLISVNNLDSELPKLCPDSGPWISAPLPVSVELQVLKHPLRLESLTLDPVWLLLSVHSCMRIYIALDRSPLQFTQFCRRAVYTTSYNLGHTLSMHYLSGAIFGAGWVVSSLELLGSPGGFARTLGTGLRDFVSLPYHGILEGPWGFLVGVTHGSASLMKHFTAGTLTSVTKMASSVARNLDRLTLDAEHLERTEELRRVRPQGVAEGLLQGLTGLGISILGAVGGLAHHPLQSVLSGQPSPRGVVTGVGRGLVGMFTKPLSGAADLVAMTGQGLLQGAGWSNLPRQRDHAKEAEKGKQHRSALVKFTNKIKPPNVSQCLLVLEATLETSSTRFKAVTLLLTTQNLIVLSADGDRVESQLPLTDIILPDNEMDPTMLTISFKGAPPAVDQRMWDFVNGCQYVMNTGPPALETSEDIRPASPTPLTTTLPLSMQTVEHQSAPEVEDTNPNLNLSRSSSDDGGVSLSAVQPAETSASTKARPPIIFHVNPLIQSHLITLLKVAQKQMQNQGFQIL